MVTASASIQFMSIFVTAERNDFSNTDIYSVEDIMWKALRNAHSHG